MTLKEFVKRYAGIGGVGNTPENKGECVGLVQVWLRSLGKSQIWGHAKDLQANASANEWVKVKNSPSAYPDAGDIINWNGNTGGGFGHTAVVLFSNPENDSVTYLEQNNAGNEPGTVCEITTSKDWRNVIGWLKPKGFSEEIGDSECTKKVESLTNEVIEMRVSRDKWKTDHRELSEKYAKDMGSKDKQVEQLTKNLSLANEQNTGLQKQLSEMGIDLSEANGRVKVLETEKDVLEGKIEALEAKDIENTIRINELEVDLSKTEDELEIASKKRLSDFSTWQKLVSIFKQVK